MRGVVAPPPTVKTLKFDGYNYVCKHLLQIFGFRNSIDQREVGVGASTTPRAEILLIKNKSTYKNLPKKEVNKTFGENYKNI